MKQDDSWYWKKLIKLSHLVSGLDLDAVIVHGQLRLNKLYTHFISGVRIDYGRTVWFKFSVPKHRFVLWQAVNNHLLTRDLLHSFHVNINSLSYPVCCQLNESHSHLFFECIFSEKLRLTIATWLGDLIWAGKFADWLDWLAVCRRDWLGQVVSATLVAAVYFLRFNRNKCVFDNCCFSVTKFNQLIRFSIKARALNFSSKKLSSRERQMLDFISDL
ncbi:uncharacterized protein LOC133822578 [Humulus lupulus]|uniref:uncharacterized protein LOC133822578 n=1 Tax=Humulus lupulus TaxID=3486 RepID=UPI002B405998|nr:uncharacterized protein LOC133822578 [Humulus lupulus]